MKKTAKLSEVSIVKIPNLAPNFANEDFKKFPRRKIIPCSMFEEMSFFVRG